MPKCPAWEGVQTCLDKAASFYQRGDYAEAERIMREALEFAPLEPRIWHMLGRIYRSMHQREKALQCLRKAVCLYEPDREPMTEAMSPILVKLLWQQGELDEARRMLRCLLEQRPQDASLRALAQKLGVEE